AQVGVIALPEVTEYVLQPEDEFLVLASDGVWEFIDNQEASSLRIVCVGASLHPPVYVDGYAHRRIDIFMFNSPAPPCCCVPSRARYHVSLHRVRCTPKTFRLLPVLAKIVSRP
ncbi:unnamed protein product, partial [Ectocarpus sp. 12 AP-2014]